MYIMGPLVAGELWSIVRYDVKIVLRIDVKAHVHVKWLHNVKPRVTIHDF